MSTATYEDIFQLTPKQAAYAEFVQYGYSTIPTKTHPRTRRIRDTRQPGRANALEMAATAAIRGATEIEPVNRQDIHSKTDGTCYICGRTVHINHFEIDHVIPLYHGGNHIWPNLLPACHPCNAVKGAHSIAIEIETGNALIGIAA